MGLVVVLRRYSPVDWQSKTLLHLALDKERGALEASVGVLLVDGQVVLRGVLAALDHDGKKLTQLRIRVVGVVDMALGPFTLTKHEACKAVSASSGEAGCASDKTLVHDGDFKEVLGQSPGLEVVVVSLADAPKEAHRAWPSKLELQHAEHEALGLQDFVLGVAVVDHVDDLLDRRAVDLFVFGGKEDGSCTDELKLAEGNNLARQEAINVVDCEEESLGQQSEAVVYLDKPVHEHGTHRPLALRLEIHVVRVGSHTVLQNVSRVPPLLGTAIHTSRVLMYSKISSPYSATMEVSHCSSSISSVVREASTMVLASRISFKTLLVYLGQSTMVAAPVVLSPFDLPPVNASS